MISRRVSGDCGASNTRYSQPDGPAELTRWMACDVEYWPTFDPSVVEGSRTMRLDAYRKVRDELLARITERFPPQA